MTFTKMSPLKAAESFILEHFPECNGALLAGSVVRGEATETSDLDIIIFDAKQSFSYRESFFKFEWPIEVFVHNLTSYKAFFKSDCERARPSLPKMISEGVIIKDAGILEPIKKEAKELLENGPAAWSKETINLKRYFITDALEDFIGSKNSQEAIFIAGHLAGLVHEFILRTNGQWIGESKWIIRALKQFNEKVANNFVDAFETFYRTRNKEKITDFVVQVLEPYGGRLFEGFSVGKLEEKHF